MIIQSRTKNKILLTYYNSQLYYYYFNCMKQNTSKLQNVKKKRSHPVPIVPKKSSLIYKSIQLNQEKLTEKSLCQKKQSKELAKEILNISRQKQSVKEKHPTKGSTELIKHAFNKVASKATIYDNFLKENICQKNNQNNKQLINKNTFMNHYIIGKGGFGKVWKVENKKNRQYYALKQMLKSLVMTKKSIQSVMNQKNLLSRIHHPFIVNMHYAFQDRQTLYLVMDLMPGGDLRYHLSNKTNFSQIQAKFFVACIIIGLQYLHNSNIIHRDIKPENLVLDSKGYLRITDLGIARIFKPQNSNDTSGTPGYMSPEVICRQNHSYVSDYFGLGVIIYELMLGKRPYAGKTRKQIRDQILSKQITVKKSQIPQNWSSEAADFVNKLIQRKPQNRLGNGGIDQIKQHPWIKQLNWKKLFNKQIQSPFIPVMKKDNFDQDEQITIDDEQQGQLIQKNALLLRKTEFQQLFKGYYFDSSAQKTLTEIQQNKNSCNKVELVKNEIKKNREKIKTNSSVQSGSNTLIKDTIPCTKYSEGVANNKYNNLSITNSNYQKGLKEKKLQKQYR